MLDNKAHSVSLDKFLNHNLSSLNRIEFYKNLRISDQGFVREKLDYELTALEPIISARTLDFHYNKHHQTYLDNLNSKLSLLPNLNYIHEYVSGAFNKIMKLKALSRVLKDNSDAKYSEINSYLKQYKDLYNNAAQCLNHSFYWKSIAPQNSFSEEYQAQVHDTIKMNKQDFRDKFYSKVSHFGSGWVWMVVDKKNQVSFISTKNAINPLKHDLFPLFVCDVWEHAYYLDYQNRRLKHMEEFTKIINWGFIMSNFEARNIFFNEGQ